MQGVVPTCLLVGVIAACHTSDPTMTDGSVSGQGLALTWTSTPTIPGDAGSNITVSSMLFRISNLRVIGDAGPGDDRTSVDDMQLAWAQGQTPPPNMFADAPTGLYSHVVLLAEGSISDYSYEIAGTVRVNGDPKQFRIHDLSPLAISLDTNATLDPGKLTTIGIHVRIDQALQSLDYQRLHEDDNVLTLDTFDDQMSNFRKQMVNAVFETDHPEISGGPH